MKKKRVAIPLAVRRLRSALDLSARDFAELVQVTHSSVLEWEDGAGVSPWNRVMLLRVAKESGRAPADVIGMLERVQP